MNEEIFDVKFDENEKMEYKYFVYKNCDIYDERINDKKFIICLYYYVEKNILTRRA